MMQEEDILFVDSLDETSFQTQKNKRARSSNFTSQEEDVLMSLVEKYAHTVENKRTNAVSWQEKNDAWEKISSEFGSQCNMVRSSNNLKNKYKDMKKKAKTAIAQDRIQLYKTGGGSYEKKVSCNDERIHSMLGKSATGLLNEYDCDVFTSEKDEENVCDIEFLEDEFVFKTSEEGLHVKPEEEGADKINSWSKWNPKKLKEKKSAKLKVNNHSYADKNEQVLTKQAIFFENEEKRAEELHKLKVAELNLKAELLQLEIHFKKLEIENHVGIKKCKLTKCRIFPRTFFLVFLILTKTEYF